MAYEEMYYDILLKKYNILKKNLIIIEQTDEKIDEFTDCLRKIDEIEQEKFKKEINEKKELTTNLEDEYKRLYEYINLIEERARKRNLMIKDYENIVKGSLNELEEIEDYNNLDFYNKRLNDITSFLNNDEKYNKYNEELINYNKMKEEVNEKKAVLTKQIEEFELNLLIKLKNSISNNPIYDDLDFDNLEDSIEKYSSNLVEKEKELSTYLKSYEVLTNTEINVETKEEYLKFINEEKKEYLNLIEKKYILLIYKYINDNDNDNALKAYNERREKINLFNLNDNSNLEELFEIITNYIEKTEELNEINLTIDSIENNIDETTKKISEVRVELNKQNIVNLLKEFCIEKEYIENNIDDIEEDVKLQENDLVSDQDILEETDIEEKKDNNINLEFENTAEEATNDEVKEETIELQNENLETEVKEEDFIEIKEIQSNDDSFDLNNIMNYELDDNNKEKLPNSIIEVKEINMNIKINEIRDKALKIMKSVCESII